MSYSAPKATGIGAAPPEFDVRIMEPEREVPLNILGMWINAVNTVYQVSATDMHHIWDDQTYSLLDYDVEIILTSLGDAEHDPPNLQTRYVIWTIQRLMLHCWRNRSWIRTVGLPTWQGQSVGAVQIWSQDPALIAGQGKNTEDIVSTPVPTNNTLKTPGSSSNDGDLRFVFRFGGSRLDSNHVFLSALEGISVAAEEGLAFRCEKIFVSGNGVVFFELRSKRDGVGNLLLRFSHVREALYQSISHMFASRRFAEMYLTVLQDGRNIGEGSWQKWSPDLGNGTAEQ